MKKLQVWSLLIGLVVLLALLFLKANVAYSHLDLIEVPNVIEIKEAMEREGWRETRTEKNWENHAPDKEDIS
jgi:hypothetical protein